MAGEAGVIGVEEFRGKQDAQHVRAISAGLEGVEGERKIKFVFSTGEVDRYGDTINPKGWDLENYRKNPVVLFGHDAGTGENVIGRAVDLEQDGEQLRGTIEFIPADINPNAEMIYQMAKAGFLSAVSVGFRPIEFRAAADKSRKGGIDFLRQELLEVSVVPIPALPSALVTEKGFSVDKLREFGVEVESEENEMTKPVVLKSLYHVSWLAELLYSLHWIEEDLELEQGVDGEQVVQLVDALKVLGQALIDLSTAEVAALLKMEAEEASTGQQTDELPMEIDAFELGVKLAAAAKRHPLAAMQTLKALGCHAKGMKVSFSVSGGEVQNLQKAGRVLSQENQRALAEAYDTHMQACSKIKSVLDKVSSEEDSTEEPDPMVACSARAEREKRARAARAAAAKFGV